MPCSLCDQQGIFNRLVVMESLRRVFWLMALFNIRITPVYYPGVDNGLADCVSRFHEKNSPERLISLMEALPVHVC